MSSIARKAADSSTSPRPTGFTLWSRLVATVVVDVDNLTTHRLVTMAQTKNSCASGSLDILTEDVIPLAGVPRFFPGESILRRVGVGQIVVFRA